MRIYTTLAMGEYHVNHCEDHLLIEEMFGNRLLCAVMDGCTMGEDSHFASALAGKLIRKIVKERSFQAFHDSLPAPSPLDNELKEILRQFFSELKSIKNQLFLETKELLTTLLLLLIDEKTDSGIVLVIGDGLVSLNGKVTVFDQDNKPDYIGYHLSEDFEVWFEKQSQKIIIESIEDISISTDGIETFETVRNIANKENIDPIHYLLNDKMGNDRSEMLNMKMKTMEREFGLKPTDDLAIIRIIKE